MKNHLLKIHTFINSNSSLLTFLTLYFTVYYIQNSESIQHTTALAVQNFIFYVQLFGEPHSHTSMA